MDIASVFLSGRTLNLLRIKSDLGYPLSTANGMLHCKVKHPLPMKWFKTFSTCITKIWWSFDSFHRPLMGVIVPFSSNVNSQIGANKLHVFGTLLVRQIRCCTIRRDIHCIWNVSKPYFDAYSRWEVLLVEPVHHLWVPPCHIPPVAALKLLSKGEVWVYSQYSKCTAELWGETYIAYELLQNVK